MMSEKKLAAKMIKDKDKYLCWASRPATMQRLVFLVKSFCQWIGTNTINFRGQGRDVSYYFEKDKYNKACRLFAKRLSARKTAAKHLEDYRKYSRALLAVGYKARKIKADKSELLDIFKEYEAVMLNFSYYFITPFWVDDYIFPDLAKKLKNVIKSEKYSLALEIISSPTIIFGYQKYHIALAEAKGQKDYEKLIREYCWVKEYSFQEKLLDKKSAISDFKKMKAEGMLAAALKAPDVVRRNKRRLRLLLSNLSDRRLREQAELVNKYINIKTERIEIYKIFQTDFRNFFFRLLELMKKDQPEIRYEDIISMTNKEVLDYLHFGRKVDLRLTRKRFNLDFVSLSVKGEMTFIYDHALVEKVRKVYLAAPLAKEIKGVIVSKGKVNGHVRLIISHSDLNKLKSGEILVANFTSPEYVPAMKKSAGIVTDDGGITSHAAIISRELGKPCITGTKIATQVLKDGDLVEVDADKGIVKIIK